MKTQLVTNTDGSQYIIHIPDGMTVEVSVTGTDYDAPASSVSLDLSTDEAEQLSTKLQTHRAHFDTISQKIHLMPKSTPVTKKSNKRAA